MNSNDLTESDRRSVVNFQCKVGDGSKQTSKISKSAKESNW